ncbi:hypothetical protein BEI02_09665 [Elizabethkingia sp. HvH-WGS333]|uniref:hypothetical protein n=1 Tax=Elizabethkingia TaxID=308865 RepID=UPI000530E84F|nr:MULTISPECIES: hypothetical protein [Elizabethkingia]KGT09698.1 hypothetical protein NV63_05505 [Elizabethkingia anophelis]KUG10777.1 hypothetical protein AMC91_15820 [Elizabethkingia miricola]MCL1658163.1 hypothetical protein [Elizabethkingia miricola]MCP1253192.1 hypothetical protein [Elizabethkingia sp. S0634]MCT3899936.1 hypothetical protein [Elizabethkingia anophelis]
MKKIVLELLKLSKDANSSMFVSRLERLVTVRLAKEEKILQGLYFIEYLERLKDEGYIYPNDNKSIYFITQKGLDYLAE